MNGPAASPHPGIGLRCAEELSLADTSSWLCVRRPAAADCLVITARIEDLIADARTRAGTDDSGDAFFGFLTRIGQEADPSTDCRAA